MAICKCPDCGGEVSPRAYVCPHCGRPAATFGEMVDLVARKAKAEPPPPVSEAPLAGYGDLLDCDEVAGLLGASKRTVYRMSESGELPSMKVGHRIYFAKKELVARLGLS